MNSKMVANFPSDNLWFIYVKSKKYTHECLFLPRGRMKRENIFCHKNLMPNNRSLLKLTSWGAVNLIF